MYDFQCGQQHRRLAADNRDVNDHNTQHRNSNHAYAGFKWRGGVYDVPFNSSENAEGGIRRNQLRRSARLLKRSTSIPAKCTRAKSPEDESESLERTPVSDSNKEYVILSTL